MGRSQAWKDTFAFLDRLQLRNGGCPTTLHLLGWYNIIGFVIFVALELGDALVLRAEMMEAPWLTNEQATRVFNDELAFWAVGSFFAAVLTLVISSWLGRLRRGWIAGPPRPRTAVAVTAILWLTLEVTFSLLDPITRPVEDGHLWSRFAVSLRGASQAASVVLSLALLGFSVLGQRGASGPARSEPSA